MTAVFIPGRQEPVCRVSSGGPQDQVDTPSLMGWAWHSLISNKWEAVRQWTVALMCSPFCFRAWGQVSPSAAGWKKLQEAP